MLRDVRIDDPRFDNDTLIRKVSFENAIHACETDDDAAFGRKSAATKAGAGSAADKGDFVASTEFHDGLYLLRVTRQNNSAGKNAEVGQAIAFIRLQLALLGNQAIRAHDGLQLRDVLGSQHFWSKAYATNALAGSGRISPSLRAFLIVES